jgi:hypothetical protein
MPIHPHELGMTVRINAPRSSFDGQIGVIDEIAIYNTQSHGIDFTGWDMLIGFHNGGSHAYAAFDFDETEIIPSERQRILEIVQQNISPALWRKVSLALKDAGLGVTAMSEPTTEAAPGQDATADGEGG